jgi:molybdopterin/thiamine biosynthesis adenylyltransferase
MQPNKPKLLPFPEVAIIGAGGVGSYLLPTLLRTIRNHEKPNRSPLVTVIDGDKLELRNMERQLFDDGDIGKYKSDALIEKYKGYYPNIKSVPSFFTGGETLSPGTMIFVCVDNHPGRMRSLDAAKRCNCNVILCGNGYTDSEAMYFSPAWEGKPCDPLVYYPEIKDIKTGDPLQPAGCTGDAQAETPQLAIANNLAASYALHLFWFWTQEIGKLKGEFVRFAPVRHLSNFTNLATTKLGDFK